MTTRVLHTEHFPKLERVCPECGMESTGDLYYDKVGGWCVVFRCPRPDEIFPIQARDYSDIVAAHTKGINPETLPLLSPKP